LTFSINIFQGFCVHALYISQVNETYMDFVAGFDKIFIHGLTGWLVSIFSCFCCCFLHPYDTNCILNASFSICIDSGH
jgi:hypothetical protein